MIKQFNIFSRFLKFYFRAKTKYSVHSPFVFEFVNDVVEDDRPFYVFKEAEILRGMLLESNDTVEVEDMGAGSHVDGVKKYRKVKSIAASAVSPVFQCEWLFRICNTYKPLNIIELGTSLGISTLYMAEGSPEKASIKTLEGSREIARLAKRNFLWFYDSFKKYGLRLHDNDVTKDLNIINKNTFNKIDIIEGNFNETHDLALKKLGKLDLCFIDGNHRYEPTIQYFTQCLKYINSNSILIFDDIHWSDEMERAWKEIQDTPSVKLTIDLFWCGIVFFRNENKEKEHFTLIKASWKPFSWGFFK